MAIPEADLAHLDEYCRTRVPAEVTDRQRVGWSRRGNTITIFEANKMGPGEDWFDVGVARIKYTPELGGIWTLYWFDSDAKAHLYEQLHPQRKLASVLREIEADPTCIFWG